MFLSLFYPRLYELPGYDKASFLAQNYPVTTEYGQKTTQADLSVNLLPNKDI